MKKRLLPAVFILMISSPSFANHNGMWHGDDSSSQSSDERCQMEENSGAHGFVMALLHDLFHVH